MQIQYCLACGMQIRADKIKAGEVLVTDDGHYCKKCSKDLGDTLENAVAAKPATRPITSKKKRGISDRIVPPSSRRVQSTKVGPPIAGIAVAACVFIVLVTAFALGGGGPDHHAEERAPGSTRAPDPIAAELARLESGDHGIDAWRDLEQRASGKLRQRITRRIAEMEEALDGRRSARFIAIKGEADALVEKGRFPEALSRWERFDTELLDSEYRGKVAAQREKIKQAERAAIWNPGSIPEAGEPRPFFARELDLDGWQVDGVWMFKDGALGISRSNKQGVAIARPPLGTLGDYHLTFEVRPKSGRVILGPRIVGKAGALDDRWIAIPGLAKDWHRVHVVTRGKAVEHWVESSTGVRVVHPTRRPLAATDGALVFRAGKSDRYELRGLSMRVQRAGALPGFTTGKPTTLFDGKSFVGWSQKRGIWTAKDGLLHGRNREKKKVDAILDRPGKDWRDYRLSLEVRDLVGAAKIRLRIHGKWFAFFVLIQREFAVRGRWYPVEFTARGATLTERLPHSKRGRAFVTRSLQGGVGIALTRGSSATFRKIEMVQYR